MTERHHAEDVAAGPPQRSGGAGRSPWPWILGGVVVLGAVVLVAVLIADTPGARLARAVDATMAEGSARTTITGTASDLPLVGDVRLSVAEGELDLDDEAAHLRRELPFLTGLPVPGLPEVGTVELLFADGRTWVRAPIELERSWVRVSGEDPDDPIGETDPTTTAPGLANPLAILGLLRAVDGAPEETGEEHVEGTATTRYRLVVDIDSVRGQVGPATVTLLDGLERMHPDGEVPVDVWVDDDDLIRRVAYEGDVDLAGVAELRLSTEVSFDDFGRPVDISAPSDDEVVDLSADALREIDPLAQLQELLDLLPGL